MLSNFIGICELFDSNKNIDILTLSETHITADEGNNNLYKVPGYSFLNPSRTCGKGGRVEIYVWNGIDFQKPLDLQNVKLENIVLKVFINKSKSILITTFYRLPDSSKYLTCDFNEQFDKNLRHEP